MTKNKTKDYLDELEQLETKASQAPFEFWDENSGFHDFDDEEDEGEEEDTCYVIGTRIKKRDLNEVPIVYGPIANEVSEKADAELFVTMRNVLPRLVKELRLARVWHLKIDEHATEEVSSTSIFIPGSVFKKVFSRKQRIHHYE